MEFQTGITFKKLGIRGAKGAPLLMLCFTHLAFTLLIGKGSKKTKTYVLVHIRVGGLIQERVHI